MIFFAWVGWNSLGSLGDENLVWLMEQSHNAYLAWIGLWLVCLLGIVNILTTMTSVPLLAYAHKVLVFILYWGLLGGMIFSVYRVSGIIEHYISWARQIANEPFRNEVFSLRGRLSRFIVNDRGKICKLNLSLACMTHFAVCLFLFILAVSFS